ncbi:muscarinic acetylcholine receptor M2-like [Diadema antillarum]|uniref:muscarinic acetylcholine receptor M2-like n=1 Tax=Diadema antillarum TaxID=105358 RepID=UPI003A84E992
MGGFNRTSCNISFPLAYGDLNVSTSPCSSLEDAKVTVTVVVLFVLSLLTVMSNSLILVAFAMEKKLRNYQNHYIFNITVADFLVGVVCMPIRATIYLSDGKWMFGERLCIIFVGVQNALLGVSVLGVVVICVDRYLATFFPLRHHQKKSKGTAVVVNVFTWLLPFVLWSGLSIAWDFARPNYQMALTGWCMPNFALYVWSSVSVVMLRAVCPFLFMFILYMCVYYRLKSTGGQRVTAGFADNLKEEQSKKSSRDENVGSHVAIYGRYNVYDMSETTLKPSTNESKAPRKVEENANKNTSHVRQYIESKAIDISSVTISMATANNTITPLPATVSGKDDADLCILHLQSEHDGKDVNWQILFPDRSDNVNSTIEAKKVNSTRNRRDCISTTPAVDLEELPSSHISFVETTPIRAALVKSRPRHARHKSDSRNSKAMKTLTLLLLAFFITWLPNSVYLITYAFLRDWLNTLPIMPLISDVQQACSCQLLQILRNDLPAVDGSA